MKKNVLLCVDMTTFLKDDVLPKAKKPYYGVLMHEPREVDAEYDDFHYTFVETECPVAGKRNPHVFTGRYVNVTMWDDGSLHPNLKLMRMNNGFSIKGYARGVARELELALSDLSGKEWSK